MKGVEEIILLPEMKLTLDLEQHFTITGLKLLDLMTNAQRVYF